MLLFLVLSALYAFAVIYYSQTGMGAYNGAGLLLPTLLLIPLGTIFLRSRGPLSWSTVTGKISLTLVAGLMLFCLAGIGVTCYEEYQVEHRSASGALFGTPERQATVASPPSVG
jgi:hypothetical protein